jgi:hypothetical protein
MRHILKLYLDDDGDTAYIERVDKGFGSRNGDIIDGISYKTKEVRKNTGDMSGFKPFKFIYNGKSYDKINLGIDLYANKHYKINRRLKLIEK